MKKLILTFAIVWSCPFVTFAIDYVSAGVGPVAWNVATSWTPNGIPTGISNVTIAIGHTITINTTQPCKDLTVNGTLKGSSGMNLQITGNYSLIGSETGNGSTSFFGAGSTISGTGTFASAINFTFAGSSTRTIAAGTTLVKPGVGIASNAIVTNLGTVTLSSVNTSVGATWINSTNSSLTLNNNGFMSGRTFTANSSGNTVTLKYITGVIPTTTSGYYNLTLAASSGTKTLPANTVVANNLTINTSNTLNSNAFDLSVGGNWTKNGTFTASAGKTVTFNGTVAQTVSSVGTTTFENLTISNTAGVTLSSGTYLLNDVLTLNNGTFNVNSRPFTMVAIPTKYSRIAPVTGTGAFSNASTFNVQRYISARDTTWCDMASPNGGTMALWDNSLFFSYPHDPYATPSVYSNVVAYDETIADYVGVASTTALSAGKGFEIFLTNDATLVSFSPVTVTTTGAPTTGTTNIALSYTPAVAPYDGQNLVGNPFASAVTVGSMVFTNTSTTIDVFDFTTNAYSPISGAGIIGPGQGFWAYATSAGASVSVPETAKSTNQTTNLRSNITLEPFFKLKISSADGSLPYAYTLRIASDASASDGWDSKDHPFRKSPSKAALSLTSTLDDGKKLAINTFNSANENYSMPLESHVGVSSYYKIEATGFEFLNDYTCVKLEDKLLNKIIDLNTQNSYSFKMNSSDKPDRFVLHLSKDSNCKSFIVSSAISNNFADYIEVLPSAQGNVINFNLNETTNSLVTLTNILGQTIVDPISVEAYNQSLNILLPEEFSGIYIIKIESAKGTITKKFVKK